MLLVSSNPQDKGDMLSLAIYLWAVLTLYLVVRSTLITGEYYDDINKSSLSVDAFLIASMWPILPFLILLAILYKKQKA